MVPFVVGVIAVPAVAPAPVYGDELADAKAQQKDLERKIKSQRALVAKINVSQDRLEGRIAKTKSEINDIAEDLSVTRKRVAALEADIGEIRKAYQGLVNSLGDLGLQLHRIELQETDKREQLRQRKAELADRIRQAYEAERTSMLETFLSGASFTDMLAVMSTQLDAAEQDRVLAQQIAQDRATLLQLHETVEETRAETDVLRQETGVQKQKLDRRMEELRKQQARLKALEKAAKAALAKEKADYAKLAADKKKLQRAIAAAAAARKKLQRKIDKLIYRQFQYGNIPSAYNGTLIWPMGGPITQRLRLHWLLVGGARQRLRPLPQWDRHRGALRDAGPGVGRRPRRLLRLELRRRRRPGLDRDHRPLLGALHLVRPHDPGCPAGAGAMVRKGQVIGHEGNTGHSTGAHLHWMVQFNGSFVNPRLFT